MPVASLSTVSGFRSGAAATKLGLRELPLGIAMEFDVVKIDPHNTHLLEDVDTDLFDEAVVRERLDRLAEQTNSLLLLAFVKGTVVGQLLAHIHHHPDKPTELYVDDLAVANAFRRQGAATRLLERAVAIGKDRGCEELWVATEPDNEPARLLYASLGLSERSASVFEGNSEA